MKLFEVATEEKVAKVYFVRAKDAAEAHKKFIAGEYEREVTGEALDCEIVEIIEAVDQTAFK